MFFLVAFYIIALQTSVKLSEENEKIIEAKMAARLDSLFSDTTEAGFLYNTFTPIINSAREYGIEDQKIAQAIQDCYFKKGIFAKFFFYKNNEFVKMFNGTEGDLEVFKDILI